MKNYRVKSIIINLIITLVIGFALLIGGIVLSILVAHKHKVAAAADLEAEAAPMELPTNNE